MAIPEELKAPIDEIKTPSNRVLVLSLILAIVSLSGWIVYKDRAANQTIDYERNQKMIFKEDARLKDSALSQCGKEALRQAYNRNESADTRKEIINDIKKKIKVKK